VYASDHEKKNRAQKKGPKMYRIIVYYRGDRKNVIPDTEYQTLAEAKKVLEEFLHRQAQSGELWTGEVLQRVFHITYIFKEIFGTKGGE
jgi:hypothetical protein